MVERALSQSSAAQAFLFYGPEGSDLEGISNYLAAGWMCHEPLEGRPCGQCASCAALQRGKNVDILRVMPHGKGGFIRLEDIVEVPNSEPDNIPVQTFVRTRPLMAKRKVIIFERAERFSKRAANALLKTLEEPEPYVRMILLTESPSRMLSTTLSRCLSLSCEWPTREELESCFGTLQPFEWVFSSGAPTLIRRIRQAPTHYQQLHELFETIPSRDPLSGLQFSERLRAIAERIADSLDESARFGQCEVLRCLGLWLRHHSSDASGAMTKIAEVHRRILGNSNSGIQFDALCSRLLVELPKRSA